MIDSSSMEPEYLEIQYQPDWSSLDNRPCPQWFLDAKLGIFIHWGPYSVPSYRPLRGGRYTSYAEWYYATVMYDHQFGGADFHLRNYGSNFQYRDFGPMFRCELFDPNYWAWLFARAGAKYVVLTAKHHDGYCLWPTKSSLGKGWNSVEVGPHRDLVGDLSRAVRAEGMRMGLYYSLIEFERCKSTRAGTSGNWLPQEIMSRYEIPLTQYINDHMIPQLKELSLLYSPSLLFGDGGEWDLNSDEWGTKEFLAWLYNESPCKNDVVVNDRFGRDMPCCHGDYFSSEYQDADTVIANTNSHPWEESRGLGGSYGFNRAENIMEYLTTRDLITEFVRIISRGGNLLINVGPLSDGRIPLIMQDRLMNLGKWLEINGEAVYETRALDTPLITQFSNTNSNTCNIYFTQKINSKIKNIYIFCTNWPDSAFEIRGLDTYYRHISKDIDIPIKRIDSRLMLEVEEEIYEDIVQSVVLLGYNGEIQWNVVTYPERDNGLVINIPFISLSLLSCFDVFVFKISLN